MRCSKTLIATLKEKPADAEVISHQLMLRAGLIRKLASGLYSWLPLGLRVLNKVTEIVRTEMDNSGALEVLMPMVQPTELWEESKRLEDYGPELLKFKDRHKRGFCLGPTHEEVITDLIRNQIQSYKQLPINCYQIQTKFRDEIRPRFGVMRAREFIMKDAYSFHMTPECMAKTYETMFDTYHRIFTKMGLEFRAVAADSGSIGGQHSHEFHVLADSGEDAIVFSDGSSFAANIELAEAAHPAEPSDVAPLPLEKVETKGAKTIEEVSNLLNISPQQTVKTLIVKGENSDNKESSDNHHLVALILRGDHELNAIKAEKLQGVFSPLTFATEEEIKKLTGAEIGSIGPVGLQIPIIADLSAATMINFVCGANQTNMHLKNTNWQRDVGPFETADIRNVCEGEPSPDGKGNLTIKRGIEVGHIFQLGLKYSEALKATALSETGQPQHLYMGCYGIGVSRIVASCIEQNYDEKGIRWPTSLAPYQIVIIGINNRKSEAVSACCEKLYTSLSASGVEVLYDDRNERPGIKFKDMELIGIPHQIIVGEKSLANNELEYRRRSDDHKEMISTEKAVEFIETIIT